MSKICHDLFTHYDSSCRGEKTYRFVHDDDRSCAQPSLSLDETIKVHQHLFTHILGNKGC